MSTKFPDHRKKDFRMPLYRRHVTVLALSTALCLSAPGPWNSFTGVAMAAPVIGTSAAVKGRVFVTTDGAERKAQVSDSIRLEDTVLTKQDSALQILLLDQTTITVGQNCELVIDRFVYDPATSVGEISASVAKGAFRFMSGLIGKANPTNATINTPAATVGIRGTFFEGVVGIDALNLAQLAGLDTSGANPNTALLAILRGPGRMGNTLDQTGTIDVSTEGGSSTIHQPNYAVFAPGNGLPPSAPFPITEAMLAYLNFFLRSTPNGESENPLGIQTTGSQESGQDQFETPQPNLDEIIEDLEDGILDPIVDEFCNTRYKFC